MEVIKVGTTELDKEKIIEAVKKNIHLFELHTWYYIQGPDGTMLNLCDDYHTFNLEKVISNCKERCAEPVPDRDASGDETPASLKIRFKCYDEFYDRGFSRLAVESCVSVTLKEKIKVRFSYEPDFDILPGQVYFMMVLEACHASASIDIEGPTNFSALSLSDYPEENVSTLTTAALKYIKIMNTGYAMEIKVESSLLKKVDKTSSFFFNHNIHNQLSFVKEIETKYALKDPKLLKADPDYTTLGPLELCGFLRDEYSTVFSEQEWPAPASSIPAANNFFLPNDVTKKAEKEIHVDSGEKIFFACGSRTHLRGNLSALSIIQINLVVTKRRILITKDQLRKMIQRNKPSDQNLLGSIFILQIKTSPSQTKQGKYNCYILILFVSSPRK